MKSYILTKDRSLNRKEFKKFLEAQQNGMRVAAEIEKLYKEGYFPTVIKNY